MLHIFRLKVQSDQKVSVQLMIYCNRQVHRDFLITLYKSWFRQIKQNVNVKVKQSHYRSGQILRVPGGWGSQSSRQSALVGGKVVSCTHRPPLPPQKIFLVPISVSGLGSSVGIATDYGLDGPGVESRWEARFSEPVQTGPGAHPASCTMGTVSFVGVKCGRGVLLTTHPLLAARSRKNRAISLPTSRLQPGL